MSRINITASMGSPFVNVCFSKRKESCSPLLGVPQCPSGSSSAGRHSFEFSASLIFFVAITLPLWLYQNKNPSSVGKTFVGITFVVCAEIEKMEPHKKAKIHIFIKRLNLKAVMFINRITECCEQRLSRPEIRLSGGYSQLLLRSTRSKSSRH